MIGETILHCKILEKLGEARPSWLSKAEIGLGRQKRSCTNE